MSEEETGRDAPTDDPRQRPAQPGDKLSTFWTRPEGSPLANKTYKDYVEELIQEAMKAGKFRNLPGRGKPLNLESDPYAERDWMVNHILSNAHVVPEWIELEKEIRAGVQWLRTQPGHPERPEQLAALNRKIDRYNLLAPRFELQFPRLPRDF